MSRIVSVRRLAAIVSAGLMVIVGCEGGPAAPATDTTAGSKVSAPGPPLKVNPTKKLRKNQSKERPGPNMGLID
jgi:hypothetical protein